MFEPYDFEKAKIAEVTIKLSYEIAKGIPNTPSAVKELGMRFQDEFLKAGFLVNVDMSPCTILLPNGRTASPIIEVTGRINDPFSEQETDHDRMRHEVLDANVHGEKYRGEKRKVNQPKKKPNGN